MIKHSRTSEIPLPGDEDLSELEERRIQLFLEMGMVRGAMLVDGLQGSGKSLFGAALASYLRKYFGQPVVSNVLMPDEFGPYTYLDTKVLVGEVRKVNQAIEVEVKRSSDPSIAREKLLAEAIEGIWEKSGCRLYGSTILLDEGYGEFERRRGQSSKLLLYSYIVQQRRHYQALVVVMASSQELLDRKRLLQFLTHRVACSYDGKAEECHYRIWYRFAPLVRGKNPRMMSIDINNWTGKWASFSPVAIDENLLKSVEKLG